MTISKSPCDPGVPPQPFVLGGIPDEEHGTLLVTKSGLAELVRWQTGMIAYVASLKECLQ